MSNVKYRVREYTPNAAQSAAGHSHSIYAEEVINSILSNKDLAQKIEARTGFRRYEAEACLGAAAEIIAEELLESNAIQLMDADGNVVVKIHPDCKGSITDAEVLAKTTAQHAADSSVAIRSVAQESDLTADLLKWTVGATVGINFSKVFAQKKSAKKVSGTTSSDSGSDDQGSSGNSDEM